jgi:hypothetical protein
MTDASEKPPNQSRRCRRSAPNPIGQARGFFVLRRQPFSCSCTLLALRLNLRGQITASVHSRGDFVGGNEKSATRNEKKKKKKYNFVRTNQSN